MTTHQDIENHRASGSWRVLERMASEMVDDAAAAAKTEFRPLLGGGTRLMLSLGHRISDDIDLFVRDPQWLGYLTPRLNDRFEDQIDAYDEGATSLKIKLPQGEIDFIVSMSLLGLPSEQSSECLFDLEPVAEVLAKKLFYRGWALTPRDLFDWWSIEAHLAADEVLMPQIAKLIQGRVSNIVQALTQMRASGVAAVVWQQIRAPDIPKFSETIDWAENRLNELRT